MTPKQSAFVDEYLIDLCATQAAIRAGYSARTAASIGERLLRNVEIKQFLSERMAARAERTRITADYVLKTIRDSIERCRQAEPVVDKDGPTGEWKFEPMAVLKGCELLGRHLKMFTDRIEHSGTVDIAARIMEARKRTGICCQTVDDCHAQPNNLN